MGFTNEYKGIFCRSFSDHHGQANLPSKKTHMSNEKNPGYLLYIGDYTTSLYGDYSKPLKGSLLINQYFMESKDGFFFVAHIAPQ